MSKVKIAVAAIVLVIVLAASFLAGIYLVQYGSEERYPGEFISRPGIQTATVPGQPVPAPKGGETATAEERMVIYNGQISLETNDITGTMDKVRSLAEMYGGYVAGTSRSTVGNRPQATITIRIPQDKFRNAIKEIGTYGKVLDERTTSEDVTERYIDLKARLQNLQAEEQRLTALLARAGTVDEVLKVERELARVRGEIESLQGQINYIERNVAMSLITVNLREPPQPPTPPTMDWSETLWIAVRGLFIVIRGLIIFAIAVLPIALVIGVPAYYLHRRRRAKKQGSN